MAKSWHRVNIYNSRMFKDLTAFADSTDDFIHIRNTIAAMSDESKAAVSEEASAVSRSHSTRSRATSDTKPTKPQSCVPFIGKSTSPVLLPALVVLILAPRYLSVPVTPIQSAPRPYRPHLSASGFRR